MRPIITVEVPIYQIEIIENINETKLFFKFMDIKYLYQVD